MEAILFAPGGDAGPGYREWLAEQARPVAVVSLASLPDVDQAVKRMRPRHHDCHDVALRVQQRVGGRIVQGLARSDGNPWVVHSWNEKGGIHFDLMRDRLGLGFIEYAAVRTFDAAEFARLLLKHSAVGDWLPVVWQREEGGRTSVRNS